MAAARMFARMTTFALTTHTALSIAPVMTVSTIVPVIMDITKPVMKPNVSSIGGVPGKR